MVTEAEPPTFATRVAFAFVCFFKILFDAAFAGRALAVRDEMPAPAPRLSPGARGSLEPPPRAPKKAPEPKAPTGPTEADLEAARAAAREEGFLVLLAALQQHGRLVDFLEDDVASFTDEEVGAAARVVHAGCKKTLRDHLEIRPAHDGAEGKSVEVEEGFDKRAIKLTGKLAGDPPYRGTLKHRGWRGSDLKLPVFVKGADPSIIAPAEVEL